VYKTISAQLLPTPAKSHYTFNLRDLSKIFQGMTMVEAKVLPVRTYIKEIKLFEFISFGFLEKSIESCLKLWYHENCRVFQDRLINDEDREWFNNLLKEKMKSDYNLEFNQVVTVEPVIYGDFMVPNADPRIYAEIEDFKLVIF
jgi:dynein heavy chain, axonemal